MRCALLICSVLMDCSRIKFICCASFDSQHIYVNQMNRRCKLKICTLTWYSSLKYLQVPEQIIISSAAYMMQIKNLQKDQTVHLNYLLPAAHCNLLYNNLLYKCHKLIFIYINPCESGTFWEKVTYSLLQKNFLNFHFKSISNEHIVIK